MMENNIEVNEVKTEDNTIMVKDLVDKFNSMASSKLKTEYLNKVIVVKPYIGYGTKLIYINKILDNSCYDKDKNIHVDSCKRYLLYVQALIMAYTNIKIDVSDAIADYDRLESSGLLETILGMIPEHELQYFDTMLQMKLDDLMTNNYDIHAYIDKKLKDFYPHLGDSVSKFLGAAEEFLGKLDEKKIEQILKRVMK